MWPLFKKFFWFLGSLKFAVMVISALAVVSIWGTFVESKYDAETAQVLVYRSIYMGAVLLALATSLIISALDRWPWKKKHLPFLVAHIGLLMILAGAFLTQRYGLDGSLAVDIGGKNSWVSIGDKELALYATQDGLRYAPVARKEVFLLTEAVSEDQPLVLTSHDAKWEIVKFAPYALRDIKIVKSDNLSHGPGVRFQIINPQVNVSDWVLKRGKRPGVFNFGPAKLYLTTEDLNIENENAIVLKTHQNKDYLSYTVYSKRKNIPKKHGKIRQGETFEVGWMGFQFRLLKYLKKAKEKTNIIERETPNGKTTSAVLVRFQGVDTWLELNASMKFFTETTGYVLSYGNIQYGLGFDVILNKFNMTNYPGTNQAASYESTVSVPGITEHLISMNEPLEYKSYLFYQASYTTDPNTGQPMASVFSVNYDPGRSLKYWGSLLVVLGSILLFYFRKYYLKAKAKQKKSVET